MVNIVIESIAVLTAILYLVLAAKEDVRCWYAALISSCLYIYIMFQAGLYMESLLQIFYVLMAVYGWLHWKNIINGKRNLRIKSWNNLNHVYAVISVIILAILSGIVLEEYTQAALPFIDAFTTWGAIVTTYMVAKKNIRKLDILVCNRFNLNLLIYIKRIIFNCFFICNLFSNNSFWLQIMEKNT